MTTWTCDELERWLDDDCPGESRGLAEMHAQTCARCREALAAAEAVERALRLRQPPRPAPAGFTEGVMRRVAATLDAGTRSNVRVGSLVEWLLADPATTAACVLVLLMGWWRTPLWSLAVGISERVVALVPGPSALTSPTALDAFASPGVLAGLCLALLPLVVWVSWLLMDWSQRLTARSTDRLYACYLGSLLARP